jgi:hypothetical protein
MHCAPKTAKNGEKRRFSTLPNFVGQTAGKIMPPIFAMY